MVNTDDDDEQIITRPGRAPFRRRPYVVPPYPVPTAASRGALGQLVVDLMVEHGLTQNRLAMRAGVDPGIISRICLGQTGPERMRNARGRATMRRVAAALNQDPLFFERRFPEGSDPERHRHPRAQAFWHARMARAWSQRDLSSASGVSSGTISLIERTGYAPVTPEYQAALSSALDLPAWFWHEPWEGDAHADPSG